MFPNILEMELSLANIIVPLWLAGWLVGIVSMTNAQLHCSKASAHLPKAARRIYFMDVALFPWASWTADRLKGRGLENHQVALKHARRCVFAFSFLFVVTIGTMIYSVMTPT